MGFRYQLLRTLTTVKTGGAVTRVFYILLLTLLTFAPVFTQLASGNAWGCSIRDKQLTNCNKHFTTETTVVTFRKCLMLTAHTVGRRAINL